MEFGVVPGAWVKVFAEEEMGMSESVGLCASCKRARLIRSDRDSVFYLCTLSEVDPRFAKYPRLPVLSCSGYELQDNGFSVNFREAGA